MPGRIPYPAGASFSATPQLASQPKNRRPVDVDPVDLTVDADYYGPDYYADERIPWWYVSDVKLHFFYERKSGDGAIYATLTKLGHAFTAEITPDHARVMHRLPDGSTATPNARSSPRPPRYVQ